MLFYSQAILFDALSFKKVAITEREQFSGFYPGKMFVKWNSGLNLNIQKFSSVTHNRLRLFR